MLNQHCWFNATKSGKAFSIFSRSSFWAMLSLMAFTKFEVPTNLKIILRAGRAWLFGFNKSSKVYLPASRSLTNCSKMTWSLGGFIPSAEPRFTTNEFKTSPKFWGCLFAVLLARLRRLPSWVEIEFKNVAKSFGLGWELIWEVIWELVWELVWALLVFELEFVLFTPSKFPSPSPTEPTTFPNPLPTFPKTSPKPPRSASKPFSLALSALAEMANDPIGWRQNLKNEYSVRICVYNDYYQRFHVPALDALFSVCSVCSVDATPVKLNPSESRNWDKSSEFVFWPFKPWDPNKRNNTKITFMFLQVDFHWIVKFNWVLKQLKSVFIRFFCSLVKTRNITVTNCDDETWCHKIIRIIIFTSLYAP